MSKRDNDMGESLNVQLLRIVRELIWGGHGATADRDVFEEMRAHRIQALAAPILQSLSLPEDVFHEWERDIVCQVSRWYKYCYIQSSLPITVPYVILKGTSAAQYYPYPEYRAMGDIDIMTRHEDYHSVCDMLLRGGFVETTNMIDRQVERHREFSGKGVEIEVHCFYALRNKVEETQLLDQLIIDHISDTHVLPDLVNGLTLIEHINHHLEEGVGLRQVLDWLMFVNKCLPDEKWPEFQTIARKTGHEQLAIAVTRMCEIYLGLPPHRWCADADEQVCGELMEYVLSSGNFGIKIAADQQTSVRVLSSAKSLGGIMRYLTVHGVANWKAAQKYPILRPLAWIYQAVRYLLKGLFRAGSIGKIKGEISETRRKEKLFEAIGVSRDRDGRVIYKDGEYREGEY